MVKEIYPEFSALINRDEVSRLVFEKLSIKDLDLSTKENHE
ncbi:MULTISPECIES: hypothetical protein [Leuconostoc]